MNTYEVLPINENKWQTVVADEYVYTSERLLFYKADGTLIAFFPIGSIVRKK